jgi:glycosidase
MLSAALAALLLAVAPANAQSTRAAALPRDEVFYQIFVRSFRDSNGDQQGDLRGIEEQLGYLQELGVTTLMLTPIGPSRFYHNYFLDDFSGVDQRFGTEADLRRLVKSLHERRMKLYLDMELQYVSGHHLWFTDSFRKPGSRFTTYLLYDRPDNSHYEVGYWDKQSVPVYTGDTIAIATVNLLNPDVQKVMLAEFSRWITPTARGANDGVDGFRIDHMQDDLDDHHKLTGLFARFWTPLFRDLKKQKPDMRIVAEQADWASYGDDWLVRGNADMVFAFPLRGAILALDKQKLSTAIADTRARTPRGKGQLVFIENHDVERFASAVNGDARRMRLGAALNLTLEGTPLIYYGQEVGMTGKHLQSGTSDGGDIPQREAFPWTTRVGPGMAVWYRDTGPWWDASPLKSGTFPSLEAQRGKPESLFSWYQKLLGVRRSHAAFITGDQTVVENDHARVFSFVRSAGRDRVLVVANLSDAAATAHVSTTGATALQGILEGDTVQPDAQGRATIALPAYGVKLYALSGSR